MKNFVLKIKRWIMNIFQSDTKIIKEVISHDEYKRILKSGNIENIQEVKISAFEPDKVQISYKKSENKHKTKRVVHDNRPIKMDKPNFYD